MIICQNNIKRNLFSYLILKDKKNISLDYYKFYFKNQVKKKLNKDFSNLFDNLLDELYKKDDEQYFLFYRELSKVSYDLVKENIDLVEIICSDINNISLLTSMQEIIQKHKSIIARTAMSVIDVNNDDYLKRAKLITEQINNILTGDDTLVIRCIDEINRLYIDLDNELLKEFVVRIINSARENLLNYLYFRKSVEMKHLNDENKNLIDSYLIDSIEYKRKRKNDRNWI